MIDEAILTMKVVVDQQVMGSDFLAPDHRVDAELELDLDVVHQRINVFDQS